MSEHPTPTDDRFEVRRLRKRKVVDTSTAETIGRVAGVHLDASRSAVSSLRLKGRHAGHIPYADVISVGPDAVTVRSADVVVEGDDAAPSDADAIGSRVLDDAGYDLGTLKDLTVDQDGTIASLSVDGSVVEGRIRGIGSYAVVVSRSG